MSSLPLGLLKAPSGIPCQPYYYTPSDTLPPRTIWSPAFFLVTYNGDDLNVQLACEAVCCSPGCPRMSNWYHSEIPFDVLSLISECGNIQDLFTEDGMVYTGDRWGGWRCGSCEIMSDDRSLTDPVNQFKIEMMGHVQGHFTYLGKRLTRDDIERHMEMERIATLPEYVAMVVDRQKTMFEKSGFKHAAWHWHRYQSVQKDISLWREIFLGGPVPEGYTKCTERFISDVRDMNPNKYVFPFYGGWKTFHCFDPVPMQSYLIYFSSEERDALALEVGYKLCDMRSVFSVCNHGPQVSSGTTSSAEIKVRGLDPFRELLAEYVLPPRKMRQFIFDLSDALLRRFGIIALARVLALEATEPSKKKAKF